MSTEAMAIVKRLMLENPKMLKVGMIVTVNATDPHFKEGHADVYDDVGDFEPTWGIPTVRNALSWASTSNFQKSLNSNSCQVRKKPSSACPKT